MDNLEKQQVFDLACNLVEDSEKFSNEVMNHLDVILQSVENLKESKNLHKDIDNIINSIMLTMESMQSQDIHRQKIERIANTIDPQNTKFARAKHIDGDDYEDKVSNDELEALIAAANN
jgi:hypothetical protein